MRLKFLVAALLVSGAAVTFRETSAAPPVRVRPSVPHTPPRPLEPSRPSVPHTTPKPGSGFAGTGTYGRPVDTYGTPAPVPRSMLQMTSRELYQLPKETLVRAVRTEFAAFGENSLRAVSSKTLERFGQFRAHLEPKQHAELTKAEVAAERAAYEGPTSQLSKEYLVARHLPPSAQQFVQSYQAGQTRLNDLGRVQGVLRGDVRALPESAKRAGLSPELRATAEQLVHLDRLQTATHFQSSRRTDVAESLKVFERLSPADVPAVVTKLSAQHYIQGKYAEAVDLMPAEVPAATAQAILRDMKAVLMSPPTEGVPVGLKPLIPEAAMSNRTVISSDPLSVMPSLTRTEIVKLRSDAARTLEKYLTQEIGTLRKQQEAVVSARPKHPASANGLRSSAEPENFVGPPQQPEPVDCAAHPNGTAEEPSRDAIRRAIVEAARETRTDDWDVVRGVVEKSLWIECPKQRLTTVTDEVLATDIFLAWYDRACERAANASDGGRLLLRYTLLKSVPDGLDDFHSLAMDRLPPLVKREAERRTLELVEASR